jgi:hypothetical protein
MCVDGAFIGALEDLEDVDSFRELGEMRFELGRRIKIV